MKTLCLDIGTKRIGVAISDALGITAQRLKTIERKNIKNDIKEITELSNGKGVSMVVIGLPLSLNGHESPMVKIARDFSNRLKSAWNIPVVEWDERFSTSAVTKAMLEGDLSRSKRKKIADELAAVYILQGYLDSKDSRR
ncbi:MAG TPA: Holliday junction resolvase RuvX [bacterium]